MLSYSDEDSFSCFSLLNKKRTEYAFLSKLNLDYKIKDFSINSYSGYYNNGEYTKLWGATIISEDMIMKKYFEESSFNFYKWLNEQTMTIKSEI